MAPGSLIQDVPSGSESEEERLRQLNKQRKPKSVDLNRVAPLLYVPGIALLRFGLKGRVDSRTRDLIFGGAVIAALAHAGYIMGQDTTM